MRAVGLKVLKNRLSEYVRMAAAGETVLVTDHDRVVAELGPPTPGRSPLATDAVLADVMREGLMSGPLRVPAGPPERLPVAPFTEVMAQLAADREDR
jgi:antitoxin (DNA-binding transcriptional repressor) of toxin-antitoxin stability system